MLVLILPISKAKTPLHIAFEISNKVLAQYLIDADVDVNAQDAQGRTPLMLCFENQMLDFVRELLEKGANPDLLDATGKDCLSYFKSNNGAVLCYAEFIAKYKKQ